MPSLPARKTKQDGENKKRHGRKIVRSDRIFFAGLFPAGPLPSPPSLRSSPGNHGPHVRDAALARVWSHPLPVVTTATTITTATTTLAPAPAPLYQMLELLKLSRLSLLGSPTVSPSYEPLKPVNEQEEQQQHIPDDPSSPTTEKQQQQQEILTRKSRGTPVIMLIAGFVALLGIVALTRASYLEQRAATSSSSLASATVPQYFQTSPEIYAGPTPTGKAPFLAATNPAPFGASYIANTPLETALPIQGNTQNKSIFQLQGNLSPYFPNPDGFGVKEYPLPSGANITQVHVLHRHGSRYPTTGASVELFGKALTALIKNGTATGFTGALSFVNQWSYNLGAEILVAVGRQELFDSGVNHYYNYAHLYNTSTKIIARSTTQDRMTKSAEYFLAGFFGFGWTNNATLELIIEEPNFNNSLAGYFNCNNSNKAVSAGGTNASIVWENIYLQNATARFNALSPHFKWNVSDVYSAQTLCPYETVAYGYSAWCDLFTYEEWLGFEYSIDLSFAGNNYFQSPTGRAVGIGYVEEILNRLQGHLITTPTAQDNITLDGQNSTFPLNQTLYFDFSHDTNIAAILTAFGLTQFAPLLPEKGPIPPNRALNVAHLQPFGTRLAIEIIQAPHPVSATRTNSSNAYTDTKGPATEYVHFILNQRTLPLGASFPSCGNRTDGWCEVNTFLATQKDSLATAQYDFACNGKYDVVSYGRVTNGAPVATPPPKA